MGALQGTATQGTTIEPRCETALAALALALAGPDVPLTSSERRLSKKAAAITPDSESVDLCRAAILAGADPLGEAFCRLRSAAVRREHGATYTPPAIVESMVNWAASEGPPARIVDPGAGSGRFLFAAARRFPEAALVAVETDPLAVLMLRAGAAVLGLTDRLTILAGDYRRITLPEADGPTLFIGNPPYVRHHDIPEEWKDWFASTAAAFGFKASKLAGLHIHFFLKTRELARPGDFGAFITSAEWLDVNYGSVLRKLLANGLGGVALHVLPPETMPFADAITTGAITCFRIGKRPSRFTIRAVDTLDNLDGLSAGKAVPWKKLENAPRWSAIIRPTPKPPPGYIELGELCRVSRGQVTGGNAVWIAGEYPGPLPDSVLVPAITKAREILEAGPVLRSHAHLRRVIDLPVDLDELDAAARGQVEKFLSWARRQDADQSYIARHRRAWWAVGLYEPAPILCTYMARRPPAFVRNRCKARHLNISHGLYPRERLPEATLAALVDWLSAHVRVESGRTYAGGLTKFEPKELERVCIPAVENLHGRPENMDTAGTTRRRGRSDSNIPQGAA